LIHSVTADSNDILDWSWV